MSECATNEAVYTHFASVGPYTPSKFTVTSTCKSILSASAQHSRPIRENAALHANYKLLTCLRAPRST